MDDNTSTQKSAKKTKEIERVFLRNYSKVIFFYPLLIVSTIFLVIELILGTEVPWLGFIWIVVFFINLLVIAFDVSTTKFFILLLVIVVGILILVFAVLPFVSLPASLSGIESRIDMTTEFYMGIIIALSVILLIAFISARFDYWKIERNEVYHKKGIFVSAERFPSNNLRIKKTIPDIFEFLLLGVGSITLLFGKDQIYHLNTIININKKEGKLDILLSDLEVEVDQLDGN